MFHLSTEIYRNLPVSVCNSFFNRQSRPLYCFYLKESHRLNKKFNFLLSKQRNINSPKPIHYYCYQYPSTANNNFVPQRRFKWSFDKNELPSNNIFEVLIDPNTYSNSFTNLNVINEKWFVNLSMVNFPPEIQCFLQLGENFSLPPINTPILTIEFIKHIECNLRKLSPASRIPIRDKLKSIIKNIPSYSFPRNSHNDWLTRLYLTTKNFLQNNKDLILTRADKGNVTVALDKFDYLNKVGDLLRDENTYTIINKDPTKKLISNLKELLSRWKNHGYISNTTYKSLLFTDGTLPRAYGLPKIHKINFLFRLIVSSINSPLYSLALFLHKIMIKNFPTASSHINNSFDLVQNLADVHLDDDSLLISLDAISLFTNIPTDLALSSVSSRWSFIRDVCGLPESEFLSAVRFVLNSTFFTFNNIIYKQTFGTPMGSPLSPIIADIVLQDLEEKALNILRFTPRLYFRYVDDILMTVPSDSIDSTLSIFNSFHDRLQFTFELEVDRKINFLDVTIIVENNVLIFDWFQKSTFSGRYLNYHSQHPLCQKKGT
ncbi:uncharacterized protein LOC112637139 [Camponotus floridanus]|uniref:uncharacterized protein LOC112637139 n=1 Tax=Camponotus floridanus TaxID=104421 RepID=UPI000DC6A4A6|nr:uncharacterized protein LOC112637139 [Camponotus floridanus]